jgi:signal transduction histidine kinase
LTPVVRINYLKENNKILLSFKDNGLGIDLSKKQNELFGLYKRFHTHVEGKGMGLFMVKAQVEAMGGKISAISEVDKGTVFTIELKQ